MKLFSRGRKKLVAIFDIGSSSVGAALVEVTPGAKPHILQVVREEISLQEKLDEVRFYQMLLQAFESVSQKLEGSAGNEVVDETVCFFSSPWYLPQYDTVSVREEKKFSITQKMVSSIVEEEVEKFEKKQRDIYGEGVLGVPKLIEKETLQVRLNGYYVSDLLKREATELDVSYFASVVPDVVLKDISEKIGSRFHDRHVSFRTFPFASFVLIRDEFVSEDESFLFVDVTGEISDIFFAEGDILKKFASFPVGKNFVLRSLAESLGVETAEATSLLAMYFSGTADDRQVRIIERTLAACADEWWGWLDSEFCRMRRGGVSPQHIYLVSDEMLYSWFKSILEEKKVGSERSSVNKKERSQVSLVGNALAKKLSHFAKGVPHDPFLSLEAAFFSRSQNDEAMR